MAFELERFLQLRPFLYHLTDQDNIDRIIDQAALQSTSQLVETSNISPQDKLQILSNRRSGHLSINVDGVIVKIRDQRPLSIKLLSGCLTNDWTSADYINFLNTRVFFWPTLKRLNQHYARYRDEGPIILRFSTREVLELNETPLFCRLNSGALRANSYLEGRAPERGENTFLPHNLYSGTASSVAEVTFERTCQIANRFHISSHPDGPWEQRTLDN